MKSKRHFISIKRTFQCEINVLKMNIFYLLLVLLDDVASEIMLDHSLYSYRKDLVDRYVGLMSLCKKETRVLGSDLLAKADGFCTYFFIFRKKKEN